MKAEQNKVKLNQLPQNIKEELMEEQIQKLHHKQQSNRIGKSDKQILKSM